MREREVTALSNRRMLLFSTRVTCWVAEMDHVACWAGAVRRESHGRWNDPGEGGRRIGGRRHIWLRWNGLNPACQNPATSLAQI